MFVFDILATTNKLFVLNILATTVQFCLKWCCDVDDSQKSSCVLNVFFFYIYKRPLWSSFILNVCYCIYMKTTTVSGPVFVFCVCLFLYVNQGRHVVVIVWWLDLQLHMQLVPITTNVVSLNLTHGKVYSIQYYVIK